MRIIESPMSVHTEMLDLRALGRRIGFVPTMGFLHRGHTSLMDLARAQCDHLVVSIYINPLQFGPDEDLDRYPQDPEGDAAKCEAAGVDTLFLPPTLYATDHSTHVGVRDLTTQLCGAARPGHFDGVTTVVARLFGIVQPHIAVFGEKDYQQLAVIRRMVRDLFMPIEILGGPLVRDHDGLALSSRNAYLSQSQRARALSLRRALGAMQDSDDPSTDARIAIAKQILDVDTIDYLKVVDADTIQPLTTIDRPARACVAAHFGPTRLIDNVALR
jgi:pantoate--beta-alanine ligase